LLSQSSAADPTIVNAKLSSQSITTGPIIGGMIQYQVKAEAGVKDIPKGTMSVELTFRIQKKKVPAGAIVEWEDVATITQQSSPGMPTTMDTGWQNIAFPAIGQGYKVLVTGKCIVMEGKMMKTVAMAGVESLTIIPRAE
jgi:hypothetical protein